jgi:hypothetical protein
MLSPSVEMTQHLVGVHMQLLPSVFRQEVKTLFILFHFILHSLIRPRKLFTEFVRF